MPCPPSRGASHTLPFILHLVSLLSSLDLPLCLLCLPPCRTLPERLTCSASDLGTDVLGDGFGPVLLPLVLVRDPVEPGLAAEEVARVVYQKLAETLSRLLRQ